MKQPFKIIVEGIADQCFLIYYLKHLYACNISSEVLLGNSSKEKERIKENKRDYSKTEHWDLNSEALRKLKEFLDRNLLSQ